MRAAYRLGAGLALAALAAGGCGAGGVAPAPSASGGMPVTATQGPTRTPAVEPGLEPLVASARADVSRRAGVPAEAVEVLSARSVTWPNGALGCPQPGMAYAEALVEGTEVVVAAAGRQWRYHSGARTPQFLCEPTPARPDKSGPLPTLDIPLPTRD